MTGDDWESIHIRCGHRPCKSKVVLIDVNLAKRTLRDQYLQAIVNCNFIFLKRVCVCIRFHIIRWSKEVCFVEQIWHGLASGPHMLQLHNFIQYFCAYRIYHANEDILLILVTANFFLKNNFPGLKNVLQSAGCEGS